MNIKKLFPNIKGFTLVELMVVVAIIGILAAIAVPNFRKYQAKSKAGEAPLTLAALYTGEASIRAVHDTFAGCIQVLGMPQPIRSYYITGFDPAMNKGKTNPATLSHCDSGSAGVPGIVSAKGNTGVNNNYIMGDSDSYVVPQTLLQTGSLGVTESVFTTYSFLSGDSNLASSTFTAVTAGSIADQVPSKLDIQIIDETKVITIKQYGY